jgi:hypothetical protein
MMPFGHRMAGFAAVPLLLVGLGVWIFVRHRAMIVAQERVLDSVQRRAQGSICEQLLNAIQAWLESFRTRTQQSELRISEAIASVERSVNSPIRHSGSSDKRLFGKLPVSQATNTGCRALFFANGEDSLKGIELTPGCQEFYRQLAKNVLLGKTTWNQVVESLGTFVRQAIRENLSENPELWRAFIRSNSDMVVDAERIKEVVDHCRRSIGIKPNTASKGLECWFVPDELKSWVNEPLVRTVHSFTDRVVLLRGSVMCWNGIPIKEPDSTRESAPHF